LVGDGIADMQYRYSLKHQLGSGGGYTHQDFSDRLTIAGSQTDIYRVFGSWRWMDHRDVLDRCQLRVPPISTPTRRARARSDRVPRRHSRPTATALVFAASFASCPGDRPVLGGILELQLHVPIQNAAISDHGDVHDAGHNLNPGGEDDTEFTVFADVTLSQRWSPIAGHRAALHARQGRRLRRRRNVIATRSRSRTIWDFARALVSVRARRLCPARLGVQDRPDL
jgi:hypothetical protein